MERASTQGPDRKDMISTRDPSQKAVQPHFNIACVGLQYCSTWQHDMFCPELNASGEVYFVLQFSFAFQNKI